MRTLASRCPLPTLQHTLVVTDKGYSPPSVRSALSSLVGNYAGVSIACFIAGCIFFVLFRHRDQDEEKVSSARRVVASSPVASSHSSHSPPCENFAPVKRDWSGQERLSEPSCDALQGVNVCSMYYERTWHICLLYGCQKQSRLSSASRFGAI